MLPDHNSDSNPFLEQTREREDFFKTPLGKKIPSGADFNTSLNILSQKKTLYASMLNEISYHKQNPVAFYSTNFRRSGQTITLKIRKTRTRKTRNLSRSTHEDIPLGSTVYSEFPTQKLEVLRVIWEAVPIEGRFPESREGSTANIINNQLILFGGMSCTMNHSIYLHPISSDRWNKVLTQDIEPRYGHSALISGNNIVVFAGGTQPDISIKGRKCLNTVKILKTDKMQWQLLITHGAVLQTRRYHIAALIGKHMFIHGGLNDKNHMLGDAALLNLERNKWKVLEFQGDVPGILAFHTACVVYPAEQLSNPQIHFFNIGKFSSHSHYNIKEPGVYVFGGLTSDGTPSNSLRILRAGMKPLKWVIPEVSGVAPSPRYMHSMTYFQDSNLLVIYGGRIDKGGISHSVSYDDLQILHLEHMYWAKVEVYGHIPDSRSSHSAAGSGNGLYIFGGISNGSFCNNQMYSLELDTKAAERKIRLWIKQTKDNRKEMIYKNRSMDVQIQRETVDSSQDICKSLPPLAPNLTRILLKTLHNVKGSQFLNKSRKAESRPNFKI